MPNTSEQWFVPLEEPNEPITIYGGQRGGGKIFALENIIAFLKESLNQANQETERWKSAALYYHEILATAPKWIPVTERLPEEHDSSWAKLYGTKSWQPGLFRKCSDTVIACAEQKDGRRRVVAIKMYDGKWDWHKLQENDQVTHWMPMPQPPKEVRCE